MMPLSRKHGQSVVENITSTLHTLIEPRSAMSFFVDWNRKRLSTTIIHRIDQSNMELLGVLRQVVCT